MYKLFINQPNAVYKYCLYIFKKTRLFINGRLFTAYEHQPTYLATYRSGSFGISFTSVVRDFYTVYTGAIVTTITELTYKRLIINKWESLSSYCILIPDEGV